MTAIPWWQQAGDTLGLPGVVGGGYSAAKLAQLLARLVPRYGAAAIGGLASAPLTAGLTAASAMRPTTLNNGEVPFYVRNPATGRMEPNPKNPMVSAPALMRQSPQPPTATPSQPMPGSAAIVPPGFTAAPVASASPVPGAGSSVPMPTPRPYSAGGSMLPPMQLTPTAPAPANLNPFYSGPGSLNFGTFADTPSGNQTQDPNLIGNFLQALFSGKSPASSNPTTLGALY